MPYRIERGHGCPASRPWAVITEGSGRVHGCHPSREEALAQMQALYVHAPPENETQMPEQRAEWDTAYINDLADSAFAYIEAGGDKDDQNKTVPRSLRHFPHHDASGKPDAAHVRNALARIPQSSVSAAAKATAEAHVRRHADAMDIGQSSLPEDYESRMFADFELREAQAVQADPDSGVPPQGGVIGSMAMPTLYGHAARFGVLSDDLGGFRERVSREAFRKTLQEGDCRALVNHDTRLLLGRSSNGTLKLREDRDGLAVEVALPNTSYARDLAESVRRGDTSGMSFGFRVIRDDWSQEASETVRTLKEVHLLDVSAVTFPAYPQTDVAMRSLRAFRGDAPGQEAHASGLLPLARAAALAKLMERRQRLLEQRSI